MLSRKQPIILFFLFSFLILGTQGFASGLELKLTKAEIQVQGMVCGGCERALKNKLESLDGIQLAKPSHLKKLVVVEFQPDVISIEQIKNTIVSAGYQANS